MMIFYKRSIERYLPFLLLGRLHDAMFTVLEGVNLVQPNQVMSDSKLQIDPCFNLPWLKVPLHIVHPNNEVL
jgi:hypothetical protein